MFVQVHSRSCFDTDTKVFRAEYPYYLQRYNLCDVLSLLGQVNCPSKKSARVTDVEFV